MLDVPISPAVRERWFRALYESPLLFSGILDDAGRVVGANDLFVEGVGLVRADVIGRPFWECGWWSPDAALSAQVRTWVETTLATGTPLRATSRYFPGDGTPRLVDLALHPVTDDGKEGGGADSGARYVVATGSDITDAVALQEEREQHIVDEADALRRSQGLFRDALDAMMDNVVIGHSVRDESGKIIDFELEFMNRSSIDASGRPAHELVGLRVCDVFPAWGGSAMFERFVAVVETGESFVAQPTSYEHARDDGLPSPGYWDMHAVKLNDGYLAAYRDVTQIVHDEATARGVELAAERERNAVELLQRAALPTRLPTHERVVIGAHYQPASGAAPIGGDWYDAFMLDDSHLALVMADVAGHGPDAAAYMVQIRNVMRALAVENPRPDEILRRVNRIALRLDDALAPFTTSCLAVLDANTGVLTSSLAGHPPPLILAADGTTSYLGGRPGPPLGIRADACYEATTTAIGPGDRIVMYTDGLIERREESLDAGMARLAISSCECRDLDPQRASEWLAATLSRRRDDVAVLLVDIA